MKSDFIESPFAWFTGVIEDINDPEQLGRVRVRCHGYHNQDKKEIETKHLPWAQSISPVTSPAKAGKGQSNTGLQVGSWVVGFFRDGRAAQDPVIMGSIPGRTEGIDDIPKQATKEYSSADSYTKRISLDAFMQSVPTADGSSWSSRTTDETTKPVYPFNKAHETESGHVFEIDDTPGNERILEQHKTGTYYEIDAHGNKRTVVVGGNYVAVLGDENVHISGNCNLTIDGNMSQKVAGDYTLAVSGNYIEEIGGSKTETISSSRTASVGGSESLTVSGSETHSIGSSRNLSIGSSDTVNIGASRKTSVGSADTTNVGAVSTLKATGVVNIKGLLVNIN